MTKVVDRLEAKGLVERCPDADDGRVQRVALTRAGRNLVPKLAALADANDEHFFGHLSPGRRRTLVACLREVASKHELTRIPTQ